MRVPVCERPGLSKLRCLQCWEIQDVALRRSRCVAFKVREQVRETPACPRHHMTVPSFQHHHGLQVLVWRSDRPGLNSRSNLSGFAEATKCLQVPIYSFLEGEEQSPPQILVMKIKGTVRTAQVMTTTARVTFSFPSFS